ncbi:4-alpha-glucanotransferase [Frateuria defendens]|uniref:4-alpha-glucanotransferase n=1 Tax=Frateuria defendens TaxID=2219559 RepID=UPI00066FDEB2
MNDPLHRLADTAGLAVHWTGADGIERELDEEALRALLGALDLPAASTAQCRESAWRLAEEAAAWPALLTAESGLPVALPGRWTPGLPACLRDEQGASRDLRLDERGRLPAVAQPGYYALELGAHTLTLAVAPPRCHGLADALEEARPRAWGVAAQVYALRHAGDGGLGDAAATALLAEQVAAAGGDALGLSPLHATAPVVHGYSPYSPSHRGFFNTLLGAPALVLGEDAVRAALDRSGLAERWARLEEAPLIDWPTVATARQQLLRTLHAGFAQAAPALRQRYGAFVHAGGAALRGHCLIAARQAHAAAHDEPMAWQHWDGDWHGPDAGAARAFAAGHGPALDLEAFAQWLCAESWLRAQERAREAGMRLGLIADVAVGFDPGGSEAWLHRAHVLEGLHLGAPPDAFNALGQQWGITGYSPRGLARSGFRPFIQLLRANLALGGGVRIDHVLGLNRLWVVPRGEPAHRGGYLHYPLADLLRLLALESWRHRAIVIGEDLGTVPPALRAELAARGVLGTDVLLFERDAEGDFLPPARWRADAVATTTTHDLPPLAGWRRGRDLDWRARLEGWDATIVAATQAQRRHEVDRLDEALGAATEDDLDGGPVDRAAIGFVARSPAPLMLLPLEDALGLEEQPNLPGTTDEHPNWRRRQPPLVGAAPFDALLHWLDRQRRQDADA